MLIAVKANEHKHMHELKLPPEANPQQAEHDK